MTRSLKPSKIIETDVLSVGGAGAGVTAAVAAARNGLNTTLVAKGKVGYSGNAIMAGGGFSIDGEGAYNVCKEPKADPSFTKELLFDAIVKESYYIGDQKLIEQYVYESPDIFNEFINWAKKAGETFLFVPPSTWISGGLTWGKASLQGVKEHPQIEVYEDIMIVDLLKSNNCVNGALGIDVYSGDIILFKAKAVVLGTGGFQPFSLKNTVSDMTGDGAAMAYRAGARLADMEFILPMPTALFPNEMKGSIYPFVMEFNMKDVDYSVRDAEQNLIDIPEKAIQISRGKKLSKLVSTYYWGNAIKEGRGTPNNGVYMDYSGNDKAKLSASFDNFLKRFSEWHKYGYYKGEDMSPVKNKILGDGLIEVGLGFEYCMGGILIDENMRTDIPGLYAAGEVTSGVFGAMRAGDGLTEMLCQGYKAGLSASDYVKGCDSNEIDQDLLNEVLSWLTKPFTNVGRGISPLITHQKIEKICDDGFGYIRDEKGLVEAASELTNINESYEEDSGVKSGSTKYNYEWLDYIQTKNLMTCALAGVKSALLRKESRGCHIRSDYPEVDHDNYLFRTVIKDRTGKMVTDKVQPSKTKAPLPTGKKKNVIDYLIDKELNYKR